MTTGATPKKTGRFRAWFAYLVLFAASPVPVWAGIPSGVATPTPAANTQAGFDVLISRFEREARISASTLGKLRSERDGVGRAVTQLKEEAEVLHKRQETAPNVLSEMRLKSLLGELRKKLEEQSELETRWAVLRAEFEEKALSLLTLYNDRIEQEISAQAVFVDPAGLDKRLNSLVETTRKRSRLQELLRLYGGERETVSPEAADWDPATLPPARDREGVRMTIRLLKDRRQEVEARTERSILREEEILKEIRLLARMREFVDDVERARNPGSSPDGNTRPKDIEWYRGQETMSLLKDRLLMLRRQREKDRNTLVRLDSYLEYMEQRLKGFREQPAGRP